VRPVVLIVDDEAGVRAALRMVFEREYEVLEAGDGPEALDVVKGRRVDLCLLDVRLPGMEGIAVLERMKRLDPALEVVLLTAVRTVRTAVEAMKLGAYDYLTKPFNVEDLRAVVRRALERRALRHEVSYLRDELERREGLDELVGRSPAMTRVLELVRQVATNTATVLIMGESATVCGAAPGADPRYDRAARPRHLVPLPPGSTRLPGARQRWPVDALRGATVPHPPSHR
jgi:DNA-binding NtrC family response regulator